LSEETSLRAALYLARDHGRDDLRESLSEAAVAGKREDLRGMAAAALWDACPDGAPPTGGGRKGEVRSLARDVVDELASSRILGNVAWGALLRVAARAGASAEPVLTETPFRWIQWGWLE
jgi:hypothetical protein